MTEAELRALIVGGEDLTTEFKSEFNRDATKEVAAFASTSGGTILVGISDNGQVLGVVDPVIVQSQIQNWIAARVRPIPIVQAGIVLIDGVTVLTLQVTRGSEPVYYSENQPYIRIGESSQRMPEVEKVRRISQSQINAALTDLTETVRKNHPSQQIAAGIQGQCELATMTYSELKARLIADFPTLTSATSTHPGSN